MLKNYLKNIKNKAIRQNCAVVLGKRDNINNEFLLLNEKQNLILKRIPLESIEKISQYPDKSWEFSTSNGYTFHFKSDDSDENKKWFQFMNQIILGQSVQESQTFNPEQETRESNYTMKVLIDYSDEKIADHFSSNQSYLLTIEDDRIILRNKHNSEECYIFYAKYLLKYFVIYFSI